MNVLFISYDGLTDPLGQSQIIPYIIGLQNSGQNYSILSFEKKKRFNKHQSAVSILLKRSKVHWIHESYTKKPAVLSTLKDINKMRRVIKSQILKNDIDAIHCRSYISMYAAFPLARKANVKLIFDMRGFWIDERVEGGIWDLNKSLYRLIYNKLKRKEKTWFEQSDLVISLTDKAKAVIQTKFNSNDVKVIPCCADEKHFDPLKINKTSIKEVRDKLKINTDEKVLGYAGSLGTWYMAEEMLKQFQRLHEMNLVDKFLILTTDDESEVLKLAGDMNIDQNQILFTSCSRQEMPTYLSVMDLGIFYIRPTFSKTASSPTKMGEMLLMGLPIICNKDIGDLNEFFEQNPVGCCHNIDSFATLSEEILVDLMQVKKEYVREVGLQHFSLESGIQKYVEAINSLS